MTELGKIIIQKYINHNEFGRLLGLEFKIPELGECLYHFHVDSKFTSTPKVAHGGFIAALMDATMGVGALSLVCDEMKVVSTLEIKVSFLRPVKSQSEVFCRSNVVKKGKTIIFMSAELRDSDNNLYATGSGTFNCYDAVKALG